MTILGKGVCKMICHLGHVCSADDIHTQTDERAAQQSSSDTEMMMMMMMMMKPSQSPEVDGYLHHVI